MDQLELSIVMYGPIRAQYCECLGIASVWTNQSSVLPGEGVQLPQLLHRLVTNTEMRRSFILISNYYFEILTVFVAPVSDGRMFRGQSLMVRVSKHLLKVEMSTKFRKFSQYSEKAQRRWPK